MDYEGPPTDHFYRSLAEGQDRSDPVAMTGWAWSRYWTLAATTLTGSGKPRVSTISGRLRPLTFLPASYPVSPPCGELRVDCTSSTATDR